MKRIAFIGLLLIAISFTASSQYYYGGIGYSFPRTNYVVDSSGNLRFQPGDMGFTLQTSAFAGSNFKGNTWFGTSVSPAFAYNVSSRFRLKAGVSVTEGFGDSYYTGFNPYYYPGLGSGTTTSIFLQGDYILSNKLMLSGSVYKYFSPSNFKIDDPRYKSPEGEGYMLNINYRPARNFEINASFEYGNRRGLSPYDPFYRGPFQAW